MLKSPNYFGDRPRIMDPLSDILTLVKPRTSVAGGFDLSGDWSIEFGAHSGIKCWSVVSGTCFLLVEGAAEAVRLNAGECVLLPSGRRHRLTKDLSCESTPFRELRDVQWRGGIATLN